MSPVEYTLIAFVASNELEVPPTVNEVEEGKKRELILSDRKASKVLGVTILRAPRLVINQKTSKVLGTDVVRSGVDWEARAGGGSVSPKRNRLKEKFLAASMSSLILGGPEERERGSRKEGQKVVLSPRWKSYRVLRRHTISCESGLNLLHWPAPSSSMSTEETLSPTAELLPEDVGEGGSLEDTVSEPTLVDLGIAPLPVPSSCPPCPIDQSTPPQSHGGPVSPTARRNPVVQKRREMIRSANKSVQILGVEARRAILKRVEKENAGRIGWSGV
jgi:hypothetical protein